MIGLSNLGKAFGDRTLFEGFSIQLNAGSRYGLVGAHGSGKTTLLDILARDEPASEGELTIPAKTRIGVLRQDHYLAEEQRILDVAMMGDQLVWGALREQEQLLAAPAGRAAAIAEIEERIRLHDGYTLGSRAGAILAGLGIPSESHLQAMSTLSGGYKLRVLLAQTLVGGPDLLLLDEPTNHLDILTIRWLEKFLSRFEGCAIIISHDHRFLDNVATHILDIDYETVTAYPGNYTFFLEQKRTTRERKETEIERQQQIIDQKKAFVERFRYKKAKARQAQSKLKQIEKIDIEPLPQTSRRYPVFRFEQKRKSGRDVVNLEGVSKAYGDNQVLQQVVLTVPRGERVGIIGANGLGKSTLLKIMVDHLEPDEGKVAWGYETHVGYFPQDHSELLDTPHMSALEYLWSICSQEPTRFVRGQLGRLLFSGDDVDKKIASLSGGESARLIFSRLIVQQPNVLVLDEPTNHLDLESTEALVKALGSFEGTIVFVSHNRWFVSRLATRIVEVTSTGLRDYPGSYEEYLAHCGDDHLDADAVVQRAKKLKSETVAEPGAEQETGDWEEQKRRRSNHRKLLSNRDKVTEQIDTTETRLKQIQEQYCVAGFFEQTPPAEIETLRAEETALNTDLEQLMLDWERIETELAALGESN